MIRNLPTSTEAMDRATSAEGRRLGRLFRSEIKKRQVAKKKQRTEQLKNKEMLQMSLSSTEAMARAQVAEGRMAGRLVRAELKKRQIAKKNNDKIKKKKMDMDEVDEKVRAQSKQRIYDLCLELYSLRGFRTIIENRSDELERVVYEESYTLEQYQKCMNDTISTIEAEIREEHLINDGKDNLKEHQNKMRKTETVEKRKNGGNKKKTKKSKYFILL